ncbi:glycosyltransferase [Mangrovivirga sp. M17]|uniref:Glycosyltransferase n=1 Tax=Mangrovivirga halotolerans TaxID=2993936 RepID=A0ABT3RUL8_9BACT|nr:glycosyltransferase [Mangrovivirga halotolerans]MCX2745206.1 glycosyltransferase [Mangrovivirga halotolerans]
MKIKVLHIIKSLGRGGAEMLLPETLKIHNTEKFEFHYIYFLPWKDQMVSAIEEGEGKVTCFNASNNIKIMLQAKRVVDYCKEYNIDIIHCHLPWAGFLGRVVHKISGIPVLYTEHNKQERYHKITYFLNKLTFNWQNTGIAVSGDVSDSIQNNIRPSVPVKTILNGVNTRAFKKNVEAGNVIRKKLGLPDDGLLVGTVAVFRFQKRLKEWLQAFAKASEQNENLYGVIVGDGPLKQEILQERQRLGLEDRVFMPGLQTNTIDWFSAMDVFMMTSEFEGLPIALLEAMSMECAVVTTNAGGIKEVIEDGKSGSMVKVEDWQKLSGEINELVNNRDKLKLLQKGARERVVESFSLQNMVSQLEDLYLETLNRK